MLEISFGTPLGMHEMKLTNQNNAAQAAEQDPLSDEYVNAVIRQHGYDSPECVIARLHQWIGLHGGENGLTLLIYEAHKALVKLRAPVADERAAVDPCGYVAVKRSAVDWLKDKFPLLTIKAGLCERIGGRLYTITRLMRDHDAALAIAPVAGETQKPVAWFIDWPDEPELGHYIAESPADSGRSRPLVFADAAPQASEAVRDGPPTSSAPTDFQESAHET